MRILHTSDWHLGHNFMGIDRLNEHSQFFDWLFNVLCDEKVDVLLVCGDIFDTYTPSVQAQTMYYKFLASLMQISSLKKTIITSGNHDSFSFLKAPKSLLKALKCDIVADKSEIINIDNQLLVCAVGFLKDGFIKSLATNLDDVNKDYKMAVKNHFNSLFNLAKESNLNIPIISMGHLGLRDCICGDSERDIYIGMQLDIGGDFLSNKFDYSALGHIHKYQKVSNNVYYSGNVIPLTFKEALDDKFVNIVDLSNLGIAVNKISIPKFREFITINGTFKEIINRLESIQNDCFIEINMHDYNSLNYQKIVDYVRDRNLNVLAIKKEELLQNSIDNLPDIHLDSLTPEAVFKMIIDDFDIDLKQRLVKEFKIISQKVDSRQ